MIEMQLNGNVSVIVHLCDHENDIFHTNIFTVNPFLYLKDAIPEFMWHMYLV